VAHVSVRIDPKGVAMNIDGTEPVSILPVRFHSTMTKRDAANWKSLLRTADELTEKYDFHQASHLWNKAIQAATSNGISLGEIGIILTNSGREQFKAGHLFRGLPYVLKAVECLNDAEGYYQEHLAHALNLLACVYFRQEEFFKSANANLQALDSINRKLFIPRNNLESRMLFQLAITFEHQQHYLRAEVFYRRALRCDDGSCTQDILNTYAALLRVCGRDAEADRLT
jgi:tetratricopeptide (TPR) repeat protein